jgi:ectoine hydroxylase-related dioxygenase (phytanoyl-CoA dioxygenase family)
MGYVPYSHKTTNIYAPSDFATDGGAFEADGLSALPEIKEKDVLYFDCQPGDVMIHHVKTLHGSSGNVSAKKGRRAASVRFASPDSVWLGSDSKFGIPHPRRNLCNLTKEGEPIRNDPEGFPVVFTEKSKM